MDAYVALLDDLVSLVRPGGLLEFTIDDVHFMPYHTDLLNTLVMGTWERFGGECVTLRAIAMLTVYVCRVA